MNDIRPFQPGIDRSKINVDEDFKRAIRSNAIADWDGTNWDTIEAHLLIHCNVRHEDLPSMTLHQIRMRFQPLRLKLSGRMETATDTIVPFESLRTERSDVIEGEIVGEESTAIVPAAQHFANAIVGAQGKQLHDDIMQALAQIIGADKELLTVAVHINANPEASVRKLAQMTGVSKTKCHRIKSKLSALIERSPEAVLEYKRMQQAKAIPWNQTIGGDD